MLDSFLEDSETNMDVNTISGILERSADTTQISGEATNETPPEDSEFAQSSELSNLDDILGTGSSQSDSIDALLGSQEATGSPGDISDLLPSPENFLPEVELKLMGLELPEGIGGINTTVLDQEVENRKASLPFDLGNIDITIPLDLQAVDDSSFEKQLEQEVPAVRKKANSGNFLPIFERYASKGYGQTIRLTKDATPEGPADGEDTQTNQPCQVTLGKHTVEKFLEGEELFIGKDNTVFLNKDPEEFKRFMSYARLLDNKWTQVSRAEVLREMIGHKQKGVKFSPSDKDVFVTTKDAKIIQEKAQVALDLGEMPDLSSLPDFQGSGEDIKMGTPGNAADDQVAIKTGGSSVSEKTVVGEITPESTVKSNSDVEMKTGSGSTPLETNSEIERMLSGNGAGSGKTAVAEVTPESTVKSNSDVEMKTGSGSNTLETNSEIERMLSGNGAGSGKTDVAEVTPESTVKSNSDVEMKTGSGSNTLETNSEIERMLSGNTSKGKEEVGVKEGNSGAKSSGSDVNMIDGSGAKSTGSDVNMIDGSGIGQKEEASEILKQGTPGSPREEIKVKDGGGAASEREEDNMITPEIAGKPEDQVKVIGAVAMNSEDSSLISSDEMNNLSNAEMAAVSEKQIPVPADWGKEQEDNQDSSSFLKWDLVELANPGEQMLRMDLLTVRGLFEARKSKRIHSKQEDTDDRAGKLLPRLPEMLKRKDRYNFLRAGVMLSALLDIGSLKDEWLGGLKALAQQPDVQMEICKLDAILAEHVITNLDFATHEEKRLNRDLLLRTLTEYVKQDRQFTDEQHREATMASIKKLMVRNQVRKPKLISWIYIYMQKKLKEEELLN